MKFVTLNLFILLIVLTRSGFAVTISEITPAHSRPFLLPQTQRLQVQNLIDSKPWAQQKYQELKLNADQGDGFSAAFLFALNADQHYLSIAKKWLLILAQRGGDLGQRALDANAAFYDQGMPWLGDVYYQIDSRYLRAFDFVYNGLTDTERNKIKKGLAASARFRKKSMDTWWQTPNLVFKPTSMVALYGLLTQDPEYIKWGFFRKPASNLGGYFSALNNMLKDNGPWYEAPIYAVSHNPLSLSLDMSDYLTKLSGKQWFDRKLSNGSSIKGLMDYYINTTYPAETRPNGRRVNRLLTYGDGSTGQWGDMYLISDNPYQRNLTAELTKAYRLSYDPGYASFLKLNQHYEPDLIERPQLPASPLLPAAPSSIWPDFGLAFLRSNQQAQYWHDPHAMAASLLFRQGYGHGHADALSLTFFGAGQLFYPDFNAVQYENPAIGWTSGSVAHNTVVVDGQNSSIPKSVQTQHDFNQAVKLVKAQVIEPLGLEKARTLALTTDYLLDVFHIKSPSPKTFDYLLHSFGRIETTKNSPFLQQTPFGTRYQSINDFQTAKFDKGWSVDFNLDLDRQIQNTDRLIRQFSDKNHPKQKLEKAFGIDQTQYYKASALKLEMSGSPGTVVGIGQNPYGLSFLAARRTARKQTTFISVHTPYYLDSETADQRLKTVVDNKAGTLIRVLGNDYIDIHAIGHGQGKTQLIDNGTSTTVEFSGYAFLRIDRQTRQVKRQGSWHSYSLGSELTGANTDLVLGNPLPVQSVDTAQVNNSVQINSFPELVILKDFADSFFTLSITNLTNRPTTAKLELKPNSDITIPNKHIDLGLIPAYVTISRKINLGRYGQTSGIDILPMIVKLNETNENIKYGITVSTGPGMSELFEGVDKPVYRIHTFNPAVDFAMRTGLVNRILDTEKNPIFSRQDLFGISDGKTILGSQSKNIETSYTWPNKEQASIIAEVNNLVRWHTFTIQDRFYIKLDSVYTRLDEVLFTFSKTNPAFEWEKSSYLSSGRSHNLIKVTSPKVKTSAIELPLKNTEFSVCVQSHATGVWTNTASYLALPISRGKDQQWSFGVCEKGGLADWVL